MIKRLTIGAITVLTLTGILLLARYWMNTQPIWVVDTKIEFRVLNNLPVKNKEVIILVETQGNVIAPNYDDVVCTEFVIKVVDKFVPLTVGEKRDIRIITTDDLGYLIETESSIIKGIQTALIKKDKGIEIDRPEDVKPGDFVQFWNVYHGKAYGHCGVVLNIDPYRTITLYSSHPLTNGYGKQKYLWPDKLFFARLN